MIVCKFGGSSLADAGQIQKVKDIIEKDSRRALIVVSAPGKRSGSDIKITDLLLSCAEQNAAGNSIEVLFRRIEERYYGICTDLDIEDTIQSDLKKIKNNIIAGYGTDYAGSRGEYLAARMLSAYFDAEFIDAADVILISPDGRVAPQSYSLLQARIASGKRYILPGFYGKDSSGNIKTFSRGGSDITGAIASRAVSAQMYENWTDVSGLLMADPRIFESPPVVEEITYREIRELACVGANVFHEEAIAPVMDVGIPINIKNTNEPEHEGTLISSSRDASEFPIAGVSGKLSYTAVCVEKFMLNRYPEFNSDILKILKKSGMDVDFIFSGPDSIAFLVNETQLKETAKLKEALFSCSIKPDVVRFESEIGVIGIVGEGLRTDSTCLAALASSVFKSLSKKNISVRYVSFGGSGSLFLLGVGKSDFIRTLEIVYTMLKDTLKK